MIVFAKEIGNNNNEYANLFFLKKKKNSFIYNHNDSKDLVKDHHTVCNFIDLCSLYSYMYACMHQFADHRLNHQRYITDNHLLRKSLLRITKKKR